PLSSSSNRPFKPCRRITGHSIIRVSAETVADFWARLRGFAAMGLPPRGWGQVPLVHHFLAASEAGEVIFCGPPDVDSPPASP
ncbi:hypothetical protein TSOC_012430, partial [Tetrabaena socialis]